MSEDEIKRLQYENQVMRDALKQIADMKKHMLVLPPSTPIHVVKISACLGLAVSLANGIFEDKIADS